MESQQRSALRLFAVAGVLAFAPALDLGATDVRVVGVLAGPCVLLHAVGDRFLAAPIARLIASRRIVGARRGLLLAMGRDLGAAGFRTLGAFAFARAFLHAVLDRSGAVARRIARLVLLRVIGRLVLLRVIGRLVLLWVIARLIAIRGLLALAVGHVGRRVGVAFVRVLGRLVRARAVALFGSAADSVARPIAGGSILLRVFAIRVLWAAFTQCAAAILGAVRAIPACPAQPCHGHGQDGDQSTLLPLRVHARPSACSRAPDARPSSPELAGTWRGRQRKCDRARARRHITSP
jgi:hypothetical protein